MRVRQLVDLMRAVDAVQRATVYATTLEELDRHLMSKVNRKELAEALRELHPAARAMREVEL